MQTDDHTSKQITPIENSFSYYIFSIAQPSTTNRPFYHIYRLPTPIFKMQLLALLTLTIASLGPVSALPQLDKRACIMTGEDFGSAKTLAELQAQEACGSVFSTGTWVKDEKRLYCANLTEDKFLFLELSLAGSNPSDTREIDVAECMDGFMKQIGCDKGGVKGYGNWKYR